MGEELVAETKLNVPESAWKTVKSYSNKESSELVVIVVIKQVAWALVLCNPA